MAVKVVIVLAYLILAPLIGGLLDGLDRIISARMQRRKGPSILQPFYDLGKLFSKQLIAVNNVQLLLNLSYLVILMIAGAMLFSGADLLMVLFILSTADMFLIMAASSDSSPYANMGASREMMQMMALELPYFEYEAILPEQSELIHIEINEGHAVLDFNQAILDYPKENELRMLEAMIWSVTQFEEIHHV